MGSLATINIKFNANTKSFYTGMDKMTIAVSKVSRKLTGIGAKMSVFSAGFIKLGFDGVKAWDVQEKAIAQVEQGLKSTGGVVGFVSQELQNMASNLQNNSLFGDEEILKGVTAQLLTFTNIAGDEFDRTQQAALDLATRLDGDLKSASIQLGKALNDPVKNLSALSRSGIQFSDDQKALIKTLWETGRAADAQKVILTELEKQYGGSAAAAAAAGLGPLKQLQNSFGDLTEEIGGVIAKALLPLVDYLKQGVSWFQQLSPETKKWIVIIGGVTAAIGPILLFVGATLPAMAAGIAAVGTAFTALTGPIGLVVAAIGGLAILIIKNWETIQGWINDWVNGFVDLYNESTAFRGAIQGVIFHFKNLVAVGSFAFNSLWEVIKVVARQIESRFISLGNIVLGVFTGLTTGDFSRFKEGMASLSKSTYDNVSTLVKGIRSEFNKLSESFSENLGAFTASMDMRVKINAEDIKGPLTAKLNEMKETVQRVMNGGGSPAETPVAGGGISGTTNGVGGNAVSGVQEAGVLDSAGLNIVNPLMALPAQLDIVNAEMAPRLETMSQTMTDFNARLTGILQNTAMSFASGFGSMLGEMAAGSAGIADLGAFMLKSLAGLLSQLGDLAIETGITLIGIKAALESLNPGIAIAAGVALKALSSFVSAKASSIGGQIKGSIPKLANGGIAYGRTLAEIGEYSGARSNPEVIAPLDRLKKLIQPSDGFSGSVRFEIEGDKLVGILDREQSLRSDLV